MKAITKSHNLKRGIILRREKHNIKPPLVCRLKVSEFRMPPAVLTTSTSQGTRNEEIKG